MRRDRTGNSGATQILVRRTLYHSRIQPKLRKSVWADIYQVQQAIEAGNSYVFVRKPFVRDGQSRLVQRTSQAYDVFMAMPKRLLTWSGHIILARIIRASERIRIALEREDHDEDIVEVGDSVENLRFHICN